MANQGAHVKWPKFNGKKSDDPNIYTRNVDERKMNTFQYTFGDISTEWYSQDEEDHF